MAKAKKSDRFEIELSPEKAALYRRIGLHSAIALLFFGSLWVGFHYVKQYVDHEMMPQKPPMIVIKNRPHWMSDFLVQRIAGTVRPTGVRSAFDRELLLDAKKSLSDNPWISKVYEVRRAYRNGPGDTLEIDCEYRAPAALVKWGAYYWLVDRDGYKLPEQYEYADIDKIVRVQDERIDIRIIEGVHRPPPETGKKWQGDDLAAGLEMAALLADKPFAQQIDRISVAKHHNPREPHVVLITRFNTEVRWGRTPKELEKEPFMEISTARKLEKLQRIYTQCGRVDAAQPDGIDIRFDVTTAGENSSSVAGGN